MKCLGKKKWKKMIKREGKKKSLKTVNKKKKIN